jgi:AraC-like DNA-binding protein
LEIAVPSGPGRLAGVTMAGFRGRAKAPVDMQVVPYPAVTVFFDLSDTLWVVDDARGQTKRDSITVGLAPSAVRVHGREECECLQVRLSPVAAQAVFGAASELDGTVVGLDELWGRDAARTHEQLRAAGSWSDRFAIAEVALARRHDAGRAVDREIAFAWGQMVCSRGRVRVEGLAAEVGWSRRRLWERFRSQIGLTPKRAAQLVRFDHAVHRLAAGDRAAMVAAESGYVDQSHLHRDVMTFTGVTPTAVAVAPWLTVDDIAWPARDVHIHDAT